MGVPMQPCSPCAPAQQPYISTVSSPFPQIQMQPCSPCTPHMQSGSLSAPVQIQPCSPCTSMHMQPGMAVPPTPPPPEILLVDEAGTCGLCIRWQSVGPMATGYVVELSEGSSASSERFVRQAPPQTVGTVELCVAGLVSGRCYAACVRSVSQSGHESSPSAWSTWQNIPAALPPCLPSVPPLQPAVANQQHPVQLPS